MTVANQQQNDELEVLRRTNAELLQKSRDRKAKIGEHEATIAALQGRLAITETSLHEATVGNPLRQLAATVSPVPELWLGEFLKHYKLESKDGKLRVLTVTDEPVLDGKEPIAFEPSSIIKLVTESNNEELASFRYITTGSLASGGGATSHRSESFPAMSKPSARESAQPSTTFGLR